MPEELNRAVGDLLFSGAPPAPAHAKGMAVEFGFEFDGIGAIEPPGFLKFLQLESCAIDCF